MNKPAEFLIKESLFIKHQPVEGVSCFICQFWVHFYQVMAKLLLFVGFSCTLLIPLFLVRNIFLEFFLLLNTFLFASF